MTGDLTDLKTSRRLAKVWPFVSPRPFAPPWGCLRCWWYPSLNIREATVEWDCTDAESQFDWEHDWPDDERPIAARPLSELEAEIKRMGLEVTIHIHENGDVQVAVGPDAYSPPAKNTINALGNVVAEAKEKARG